MGSNPVGDANKIKNFRNATALFHGPIWSSYFETTFFNTFLRKYVRKLGLERQMEPPLSA